MIRSRSVPFLLVIGLLAWAGCSSGGDEQPDAGPFVAEGLDVLLVVDNSRSMIGEQTALAHAFGAFTAALDEKVGPAGWRLAVVTTGMESNGCAPCPPNDPNFYSCTNETGESGRFQERLGRNLGDLDAPELEFTEDASCRVMDPGNVDRCFYDAGLDRGVVFAGVNGCGYEKGLAPVRAALSEPLLASWNAGLLRPKARLAVVVLTDEEDCGEVGDVTENLQGISGRACYYAAAGAGPDGATADPQGRPYRLTPVSEIHAFLMGLKDDRPGGVRFAAIVGLEDPAEPGSTRIRFADQSPTATVLPACSTPGCQSASGYCDALPGTRYVALAELFGLGRDGFADTICQADFSDTLTRLADFLTAD